MSLILDGTIGVQGNSGAFIADTAKASTSGTSIDFTGIPSWVKRITVMFSGVSTSGSSNILVQLGDAGGIENTGYVSEAITTTNSSPYIFNSSSTAGFIIRADSNGQTCSGIMTVATLGSNSWVESGTFYKTAGSMNFSVGSKSTSETLDRLRITTVNGTDTFDAGTINILYE